MMYWTSCEDRQSWTQQVNFDPFFPAQSQLVQGQCSYQPINPKPKSKSFKRFIANPIALGGGGVRCLMPIHLPSLVQSDPLVLGKMIDDPKVRVLSGCIWKRSGPLWTSSSRSILRFQKKSNKPLYIQVNNTFERQPGMERGLKETIFWLFERAEVGRQPPPAGIQIYSHSMGEKCNQLVPELCKSWEELGLGVASWRQVRFLACKDVEDWHQTPNAKEPFLPQGTVYRKPFQPCPSAAAILEHDWSQGVFLPEEDLCSHKSEISIQIRRNKGRALNEKALQVIVRALQRIPEIKGLELVEVGFTDRDLRSLTTALKKGFEARLSRVAFIGNCLSGVRAQAISGTRVGQLGRIAPERGCFGHGHGGLS